ncbi:MAG: insulinase family protein, partial [Gammaproteobacteria bacterium]
RYPVRDPFFMMLRRSLNTYMNAFTSTDTTAYPFATQNRKDFDNLLGVYLDAVFFPRLDPLDFAQEGWRLELAEDGAALEYHGVVYNEMKGAMSAPVAQLWQHLHTALFPDTVYRHNSGGDPLAIPQLSYAALRDFHTRHYHPSNAVFMTYGSFAAAEHQARIEQLALARFKERRAPLISTVQTPFVAPRRLEVGYEADAGEPRNTHIVWAWVHGATANVDELIELHLLGGLLLEHGASPVRHYFETTPLADAPSELSGIDDSAAQLVFMCGVEGSERAHAEALEDGLLEILARVARDGLPRDVVEAALDRLEMAQRDIGGDGYPFGLQLMGRVLAAAMQRRDARALLDLDPVLARLRAALDDPGYVPDLVRRILLDNPHRVRLVMYPEDGKAAHEHELERARLAQMRAEMDAGAIAEVAAASAALAERQAREDDPDVLPRVTLTDVPPPADLLTARERGSATVPCASYECAANGVFRARLACRLPALTPAETAALPLFCEYLTELGCDAEDYLAVQARRAAAGSFQAWALVRPGPADDGALAAWLLLGGKGLARKREAVLATLAEMLAGVRFDEPARLAELLQQSCAEAEQSITERGHQLAILTAAARLTPTAALDALWDGPAAIRALQAATADANEAAVAQLFATFESIRGKLLAAPRELALIGDAATLDGLAPDLAAFAPSAGGVGAEFVIAPPPADEVNAWLASSQVNFCAKAYRAVHESDADAPVLAVLGRYLQDGFLHREIREKGGAYGSGAAYDADSQTFRFFSYRDPRVGGSFADFDRALEWFAQDDSATRLEEAVLGTIRALDQPRSPAGEAERAFIARLCGRDDAARRRFREGVLAVDHAALRAAAARLLEPSQGRRGVVAAGASEAELADAGFALGRL